MTIDKHEDRFKGFKRFNLETKYKKSAGIQCVVTNTNTGKVTLNLAMMDLKCAAVTGTGGAVLKAGVTKELIDAVFPFGGRPGEAIEDPKLAPWASAILGQLYKRDENGDKAKPEVLSDAGRICRCALKNRVGVSWKMVKVEEQGRGALRETCKRGPTGETSDGQWAPKTAADCKRRRFHQPTNVAPDVDSIKRAILHAGPVTARLDVFDDFQAMKAGTVYSKSDSAQRTGGHGKK